MAALFAFGEDISMSTQMGTIVNAGVIALVACATLFTLGLVAATLLG